MQESVPAGPETIYANNTANAGKVTVGKSVSDTDITVNGQAISRDGDNNFLVTISQSAQSMGLTSQSSVPVDVVFVLDTSNSMAGDRVTEMITAANGAIATLMQANENNRVAVVAFSGSQGGGTSSGASALEGQTELLTNVVSTTVQEIPVPSVTPNTGDSTNIPVLTGMMGIRLLGIVVTLAVLLFPRKKESMKHNPE